MQAPQEVKAAVPGRLVKAFENLPSNSHSSAWTQLWDHGASDLWDRGGPSPSLVDLLDHHRDMFNPIAEDGRRKTALVPGCGRGYDVALLALHGYDAYGLEVSPKAVAVAQEYTSSVLENPPSVFFPTESEEEVAAYRAGRGKAHIIQADFFEKDWAGEDVPSQFDLAYDYTFFCALPPDLRRRWGARMADKLSPSGYLVCLEFPLYKDPTIEGPPWGVGGGVYWDVLARGGSGILDKPIPQEVQDSESDSGNGSFVRSLFIKPERYHVAGKGTDMLSVWKRKRRDL